MTNIDYTDSLGDKYIISFTKEHNALYVFSDRSDIRYRPSRYFLGFHRLRINICHPTLPKEVMLFCRKLVNNVAFS